MHKISQKEIDEVCEAVGTTDWSTASKEGVIRASRMPLLWEIGVIANEIEKVWVMARLNKSTRAKLKECFDRLNGLMEGVGGEEMTCASNGSGAWSKL